MIHNFADFLQALDAAGFSVGGENGEGVFTLCDEFGPEIHWHTDEKETDPWEWRMRVLSERQDIAYGKVFFQKSGYITKAFYPCFLAVRRRESLEERYERGVVSALAMNVYQTLREKGPMPLHALKSAVAAKDEKSAFDRALTGLQMSLYITMCGQKRKSSALGLEYGWNSTVLCRTEDFFGPDVFEAAGQITKEAARSAIREQVLRLSPAAQDKKIERFIFG